MTPGVLRGISEEQNLEKQIEKQMGCMAGFFQIFDRHQVLAGKRIYSTKRLPSSPVLRSTSPSEKSEGSVSSFYKDPPSPTTQKPPEMRPPSAEPLGLAEIPARPSLPLPVFEFKEGLGSSWKLREAPRLSLDSRAIVDGKGKLFPREIRTTPVNLPGNQTNSFGEAADDQDSQRRSPSVVARLMGLDVLPNAAASGGGGDAESFKRAELRRSASESRASRAARDLLQFQFIDGSSCQQMKLLSLQGSMISEERTKEFRQFRVRDSKPEHSSGGAPISPPPPPTAYSVLQRKSFFDAQDYFIPELSKRGGSLYGEIEKRLRMRGIDDPAKDLEALKQILETLQLKGLLHSKQQQQHPGGAEVLLHQINGRNLIYDHHPIRNNFCDSPIVVMKPASRSQSPRSPLHSRSGVSPTPRRNNLAASETASPGRMARRVEKGRSLAQGNVRRVATRPDPGEAKTPNSLVGKRNGASNSVSASTRGRVNSDRRIPSIQSPKAGSPRKLGTGSDPTSRSPRNRKTPAEFSPRERISARAEDESSTVSEGSISSSSQFDFERVKMEEYKEGRSLLERCDKLLHSIAEMTSDGMKASDEEEQVNAAEQQPSPVSVLDAAGSFYCDETASPSPPVGKRCIDFKDQSEECVEDQWNPTMSSVRLKPVDVWDVDEGDFLYVSEILRASDPNRTTDIFTSLEKQQHQNADEASASHASRLHRRMVFDTVAEIVDRRSKMSPWDAFSQSRSPVAAGKGKVLPSQVWAELRRIQEHVPAYDLCDVICGVLRKDMTTGAAERGWGDDRSVEMSDAVLDIERLIFKDLIAETISDLAATTSSSSARCRGPPAVGVVHRRKLLF